MRHSSQSQILAAVILLTSGCGPAYPLERPDQSVSTVPTDADRSPAIDLGLQVLSEGPPSDKQRPKAPDLAMNLEGAPLNYEPKYFKNQISLSKPLHLPDVSIHNSVKSKKLHFVWPDTFGGVSIVGASVSHWSINGNNEWVTHLKTQSAWHDAGHKRWVVSIAEVFSEASKSSVLSVSEAETQILNLDLTFANGSKNFFQVKFRISGQIPS